MDPYFTPVEQFWTGTNCCFNLNNREATLMVEEVNEMGGLAVLVINFVK